MLIDKSAAVADPALNNKAKDVKHEYAFLSKHEYANSHPMNMPHKAVPLKHPLTSNTITAVAPEQLGQRLQRARSKTAFKLL